MFIEEYGETVIDNSDVAIKNKTVKVQLKDLPWSLQQCGLLIPKVMETGITTSAHDMLMINEKLSQLRCVLSP